MMKKTIVHLEVRGNSAKMYQGLKQKAPAIELALRLLAKSEFAGVFFDNMKDINAILREENGVSQITEMPAQSNQKEKPAKAEKSQEAIGNIGSEQQEESHVPVVPEPQAPTGDGAQCDENGFEDGWTTRSTVS